MAAQPPPATGGIPPASSAPPQQATTAAPTANRFPAAAAPAPATPAPAAAQPFRPLNVKDALRYVHLAVRLPYSHRYAPSGPPSTRADDSLHSRLAATSTASRSPSMIRQRVSYLLFLHLLTPLTLPFVAIAVYDRFLTVRFLRVRRALYLALGLTRIRRIDHEGVQESGNRHSRRHRTGQSFQGGALARLPARRKGLEPANIRHPQVSTLFRGHPALIQGFNTFLPPGYRIECSVGTSQEEGGVTTITVTTPMGMTTRTQVTGTSAAPASASTPARAPATSTSTAPKSTAAPSSSSAAQKDGKLGAAAAGGASTARSPVPAAATKPTDSKDPLHLPSIPPANLAAHSSSQPIATPGAASLLSNHLSTPAAATSAAPAAAGATVAQVVGGVQATATSTDPQGARPPMEFNHAINYVNKIKNRFVRDPDTYKAFLEILQTYQKEGRAIQDVRSLLSFLPPV